jgi:hypothetical protein
MTPIPPSNEISPMLTYIIDQVSKGFSNGVAPAVTHYLGTLNWAAQGINNNACRLIHNTGTLIANTFSLERHTYAASMIQSTVAVPSFLFGCKWTFEGISGIVEGIALEKKQNKKPNRKKIIPYILPPTIAVNQQPLSEVKQQNSDYAITFLADKENVNANEKSENDKRIRLSVRGINWNLVIKKRKLVESGQQVTAGLALITVGAVQAAGIYDQWGKDTVDWDSNMSGKVVNVISVAPLLFSKAVGIFGKLVSQIPETLVNTSIATGAVVLGVDLLRNSWNRKIHYETMGTDLLRIAAGVSAIGIGIAQFYNMSTQISDKTTTPNMP